MTDPAAAAFTEAYRLFAAGQAAEAERLLQSLLAREPEHGRALHLLGIIAYQTGRNDRAIELIGAALRLNGREPSLHNNLGNALAKAGRTDAARQHYEQAVALKPDHVEALYNLGHALAEGSRWSEAVACYQRALAIKPDYADAWTNLALAQTNLGQHEDALASCDRALAFAPARAAAHNNRGLALAALDRFDEAMASFRQALVLDPGAADVHGNIGTALVEQGRIDEAMAAFERGLALAPRHAKLHFCSVQARRVTAGDPRLAALEELARDQSGLNDAARVDLHFALAKAYADVGRADDAFATLVTGNRLKRKSVAYDEAATLGRMATIARAATRDAVARFEGAGQSSDRPVFILGMPRSGSTLVEQILASHPAVAGGGELPNLERAIAAGLGPGVDFPAADRPAAAQAMALRGIAERYLASLDSLARDAIRVTDKMPTNFLFVGLIHLALPRARIIHTRRDPMDVGVSCFSTLFTNVPYAYDLGEIGRYYRAYDRLMRHWRGVLPEDAILDVDYEALVADFPAQARRIVAHCGLPWDDACLSFQAARRAVKTASAAQVRQPLYGGAVGRWRALDPARLEPLAAALGL